MSQTAIKLLALAAMTLNHFAHIFLPPDTLLYELFVNIGYFTAITMCYFLVEGSLRTRSRKKYAQRLLLFAALSQLPFQAAFGFFQLNMLFTLFFCLLLIICMDQLTGISRSVSCAALVAVTAFCDWAGLAALFTILFVKARRAAALSGEGIRKTRSGDAFVPLVRAYLTAWLLFVFINTASFADTSPVPLALLRGAASGFGILLSGLLVLFCYDGTASHSSRPHRGFRWLFYLYYPAHLIVLAVLAYFMKGL